MISEPHIKVKSSIFSPLVCKVACPARILCIQRIPHIYIPLSAHSFLKLSHSRFSTFHSLLRSSPLNCQRVPVSMRTFAATKMPPATLLLLLAGAGVVSSSPVFQDVTNGMLTSCSTRMDGKLPYYQPMGFNFSGNIRRYYVAAEVDTWNYAPTRMYSSHFEMKYC